MFVVKNTGQSQKTAAVSSDISDASCEEPNFEVDDNLATAARQNSGMIEWITKDNKDSLIDWVIPYLKYITKLSKIK